MSEDTREIERQEGLGVGGDTFPLPLSPFPVVTVTPDPDLMFWCADCGVIGWWKNMVDTEDDPICSECAEARRTSREDWEVDQMIWNAEQRAEADAEPIRWGGVNRWDW